MPIHFSGQTVFVFLHIEGITLKFIVKIPCCIIIFSAMKLIVLYTFLFEYDYIISSCRFPLPKFIIDEFQQKIPNSVFTTNPCRIQYCTHEIVVIREDLVTKMCRNTVHFPNSGEISEHVSI